MHRTAGRSVAERKESVQHQWALIKTVSLRLAVLTSRDKGAHGKPGSASAESGGGWALAAAHRN